LLILVLMAIVQALVTLVTRSFGRILGALFGWAVVAIFGHTSSREKLFLSGLLAAAGAWPVLVLGVAAPRAVVFLLAFVPLPASIPAAAIRPIWIGLAVVVPLAVGLTMMARQPAGRARGHWAGRLLGGFPITLGLSAALLITLVTVPVLRLVALVRRQQAAQVPLVTDAATYGEVAERIAAILEDHGRAVRALPAPWWLVAPLRVLTALGGAAFQGRVPPRLAYFEGSGLILVLYPSGLLVQGSERDLARAQGLIVEGLSDLPVWQTFDPGAQDIERQISRLWTVYRQRPADHRDAAPLLSRLAEIAAEIEVLSVSYDEWQVVYRKALQLRSALHGDPQLLDRQPGEETMKKSETGEQSRRRPQVAAGAPALSTPALIEAITKKAYLLAQKEIALARAELAEDVRSELAMLKWLVGAGALALVGVTVLLVAGVLALAPYVQPWLAALVLGGAVLAAAAGLGFYGWQRRVQSPLDVTRKSLKDNWRWAKERLA
jgi:hypothetical protein